MNAYADELVAELKRYWLTSLETLHTTLDPYDSEQIAVERSASEIKGTISLLRRRIAEALDAAYGPKLRFSLAATPEDRRRAACLERKRAAAFKKLDTALELEQRLLVLEEALKISEELNAPATPIESMNIEPANPADPFKSLQWYRRQADRQAERARQRELRSSPWSSISSALSPDPHAAVRAFSSPSRAIPTMYDDPARAVEPESFLLSAETDCIQKVDPFNATFADVLEYVRDHAPTASRVFPADLKPWYIRHGYAGDWSVARGELGTDGEKIITFCIIWRGLVESFNGIGDTEHLRYTFSCA